MPYQTIYTGTIFTASQSLTVDIEQDTGLTPLPTETTVDYEREFEWTFSQVAGGSLARGQMGGSGLIKILDENEVIFNHLSDLRTKGAEDTDLRVHITSSEGDIDFYAFVRIKNLAVTEGAISGGNLIFKILGQRGELIFGD